MRVSEEARRSQEELILRPESRMLLSVWRMQCGDHPALPRESLDLRQLKRLVPNLFIAAPCLSSSRFTYRLAGTGLCRFLGREVTGEEVFSGWDRFERGLLSTLFSGVSAGFRQASARLRYRTERGETAEAEMLALPMLSLGGTEIHVLGGLFPLPDAPSRPHLSLTPRELSAARFLDHSLAPSQAPRKFRVISGGLDAS